MVHGETTTRSPFDADDVLARLRARGVAQLQDESGIWVILDGSDLRKPYAQAMEGLQRVKRLSGGGMITGTNFLAGVTVTGGGTKLTVTTPAHAAGVVDVNVVNSGGIGVVDTLAYTYGVTTALPGQ